MGTQEQCPVALVKLLASMQETVINGGIIRLFLCLDGSLWRVFSKAIHGDCQLSLA